MKERLTLTDFEGYPCPPYVYGGVEFYGDSYGGEVIEKLAEYEDAEEQGLILRLPCKVGSMVYHIINNTDACLECPHYSDFYGIDSMCSKNKGKTVFEPRWQDKPICEEHFYEISERKADVEFIVRNLDDFGETVFLTKEEAERALAKMKGDGNNDN